MTSFIPITLIGDNLGQRHRHLNFLVDQAYQQSESFQSFQQLPDQCPIDRLFKIDLASKHKHVEYILGNLKDEDMLYVSRALKSYWLLKPEFAHIINPIYLEETLYPEMTTTAVNKLKQWVSLNLRDPQKCEQFFEYYYDKIFDFAIKFLWRCSNEYILSKVANILDRLTPHHLKMLSENCPDVARTYFDSIKENKIVLKNYLKQEREYYNSLKCILKIDANIFLDITEQYFDQHRFKKFSSEATQYVMSNHKARFDKKPELYAAWLLDMKTLAKCLTKDESKELVLKLARAKYLKTWFSYKNVELLVKNLNVEERVAFKKQVFEEKSIGEIVEEWPYKPPSRPEDELPGVDIFQDIEPVPHVLYENVGGTGFGSGEMMRYRRCADYVVCPEAFKTQSRMVIQSPLEQLFDRYRFTSFEKTLFELKKKIAVENLQNRQNMMLVLVSKSGGRAESVEQLMTLLMERHENEPVHLRATVVRSLIKRCSAWRLPQSLWDLILKFGRDLGFDGKLSTVACHEGLHAVVLRNMLIDRDCNTAVWDAFLKNFSNFKEYSLTAAERRIVSGKLPALLLADVEANPSQVSHRLNQLLETLIAYNIQVDKCPGAISAIKAAIQRDINTQSLLHKLFSLKIARRDLFKEYFSVIRTGPSYFNALKHDSNVLQPEKNFEELLGSGNIQHERFLRALALYFGEQNGLAEKYLSLLENRALNLEDTVESLSESGDHQRRSFPPVVSLFGQSADIHQPRLFAHKRSLFGQQRSKSNAKNPLARPIALLAGVKLIPLIQKLDESPKHSRPRRLAVALRANAHLSRPLINLETIGWQSIGAKAIANRVLKCSTNNVEPLIEKLLSGKRTERLAIVLSMRIGKEYSVLTTVASKRPRLALRVALWHLRRTNKLDLRLWDIIIPIIAKLDISGILSKRLRQSISNVSAVPKNRKPEYCEIVFDVFKKISKEEATPMLFHLESILSDMDGKFIEKIVRDFLDNDFIEANILKSEYQFKQRAYSYTRIVAKFLQLSKNESEQMDKLKNVGQPLLAQLSVVWNNIDDKSELNSYINTFIHSLKYTKAFLNPQYVSCLPVFEYIIKAMQKILPVELNFDKYVQLHLTMLYHKSIRLGMKNNPELFEDLPNKIKECVEVVGLTFGKYIAHEIKELKAKYFDSILDLYKMDFQQYLNSYFEYDITRIQFKISIIKGILRSEENSHLLAQYMYNQEEYSIKECVGVQIRDLLNESKSQEVKFFLHAGYI